PVPRVAQRALAGRDPLAFEQVAALDQPLIDLDRQLELGREGLGGLLGALQRTRDEVGDVVVGQRLRRRLGHPPAQLRQLVAGHPAVKDLFWVIYLAVAEHVHDRLHRPAPTAPAARAACGSAVSMTSSARSSIAVDTNQASYALGGR